MHRCKKLWAIGDSGSCVQTRGLTASSFGLHAVSTTAWRGVTWAQEHGVSAIAISAQKGRHCDERMRCLSPTHASPDSGTTVHQNRSGLLEAGGRRRDGAGRRVAQELQGGKAAMGDEEVQEQAEAAGTRRGRAKGEGSGSGAGRKVERERAGVGERSPSREA